MVVRRANAKYIAKAKIPISIDIKIAFLYARGILSNTINYLVLYSSISRKSYTTTMKAFDADRLLPLLRCPVSRQPLIIHDQILVSKDSDTRCSYPIRAGIPVLLAEESTQLSAEEWQKIIDLQPSTK